MNNLWMEAERGGKEETWALVERKNVPANCVRRGRVAGSVTDLWLEKTWREFKRNCFNYPPSNLPLNTWQQTRRDPQTPPTHKQAEKSDMNANLFKRRNLIIFLIDFVWWFSCRAENRITFIRCPIDNSKTTTWSFFDPKNERSWPVSIVCWRDRAACGGWTLLWRNHGSDIFRPPFAVFIVSKSIATVQKLNFTLNRLIGLFHCVYDPSIPKSLSRAPLQRFLIEKALFLSPDVLDTTRKLSLWVFLVLFRDWKSELTKISISLSLCHSRMKVWRLCKDCDCNLFLALQRSSSNMYGKLHVAGCKMNLVTSGLIAQLSCHSRAAQI